MLCHIFVSLTVYLPKKNLKYPTGREPASGLAPQKESGGLLEPQGERSEILRREFHKSAGGGSVFGNHIRTVILIQ